MSARTAAPTLHIDWTKCRGRGVCTELLAGLGRDPWGYPLVRGGGSDLPLRGDEMTAAREAVDLCPLLALSIRTRS
ncbi:ferredoxin [Amnibacterium sp.]|uniref:ferredoxin n=1 Tax=Amnibacterium sp. TaxID=1872496 RepID=UPI003F7B7A64